MSLDAVVTLAEIDIACCPDDLVCSCDTHSLDLSRYPEGDIDSTNVSIVVTNVGADFTKLGSFGTASAFGENLVASMDRRYLARAAWGANKDAIQVCNWPGVHDNPGFRPF